MVNRQGIVDGRAENQAATNGRLREFENSLKVELERAAEAAAVCDLFLVLGSSLVVHPAAQLPAIAVRGGADLVILNGQETPLDSYASTVIRTPLAQTFARFGE